MYYEVCKLVNVFKEMGVVKGDCVVIYMLMVFEVVYVMLVCVWIGVVYLVIFGGFLFNVIVDCINDSNVKVVIIVDEGCCVGRSILLKVNVDKVLFGDVCLFIIYVLVYKFIGGEVDWNVKYDVWWYDVVDGVLV